MKFGKRVTS